MAGWIIFALFWVIVLCLLNRNIDWRDGEFWAILISVIAIAALSAKT